MPDDLNDDDPLETSGEPATRRLRYPRNLDPNRIIHPDAGTANRRRNLLHPLHPPGQRDAIGLAGVIRLWVRPDTMAVADFQALRPGQLRNQIGPPDAVVANMWTNSFYFALLNWLGNLGGAPPQALYLALGTGTLPAQGVQRVDSAMVTESIRKALTYAQPPSGDPVSTVLQFFSPASDAAAAVTYTEAGLFSASSAGTMLTHAAFPYARSANVDLTVTYTLPRIAT